MAQSIITFTEESELILKKIEVIANKNGIIIKNKVAQTNYALSILDEAIKFLDEETWERVFSLKK
jgi:hypothetical protein